MKKLPGNHHKENAGILALAALANEKGWVWRETPRPDTGIDGELEIVKDGYPTGAKVAVQVKSGTSYFRKEDETKFEFRAKSTDVAYWAGYCLPVLLVLFNPATQTLYGILVSDYVAEQPKGWLVYYYFKFGKEKDRLDLPALERIEQRVREGVRYRANPGLSYRFRTLPTVAGIVTLLTAVFLFAFIGLRPASVTNAAPGAVSTDTLPPTTAQVAAQDFPHTLRIGHDFNVVLSAGPPVPISVGVVEDFDGGSEFLTVLVPSSPNTFAVCVGLPSRVPVLLKETKASHQRRIQSKKPGDSPVWNTELKFSGKVFVYHDDYLEPKQLGVLIDAFKAKGYNIQFRGPDYVQAAYLSKLAER